MRVADIQRFCMHDGPGIRTTVFLKGCPLRCAWCHNPETQSVEKELLFYPNKCIGCGACTACPAHACTVTDPSAYDRSRCVSCGVCAEVCPTGARELCGTDYTVDTLLRMVKKDSPFYGETGGVTLSGGEPLMQAEEVLLFLQRCREHGIHTAVETCGAFAPSVLERLVPVTDLFLWDVKDTDPERHRTYTGVSCEGLLQNLRLADRLGANTRLRCILVNGVNTVEAHYEGVLELTRQLVHCEGVEWIPYHSFGGAKAMALGRENNGKDAWIPTQAQIQAAEAWLSQQGVTVF